MRWARHGSSPAAGTLTRQYKQKTPADWSWKTRTLTKYLPDKDFILLDSFAELKESNSLESPSCKPASGNRLLQR
jgi:hypothetical protein